MAATSPIERSIQTAAVERLKTHLRAHDDQRIFTLSEIAESTAMDPNTVEGAMELLAGGSPAYDIACTVCRQSTEYGETRWRVRW